MEGLGLRLDFGGFRDPWVSSPSNVSKVSKEEEEEEEEGWEWEKLEWPMPPLREVWVEMGAVRSRLVGSGLLEVSVCLSFFFAKS